MYRRSSDTPTAQSRRAFLGTVASGVVATAAAGRARSASTGLRGTFRRPPTDLATMKADIDEYAAEGVTDLAIETFFHGETIYPSAYCTQKGYPDDFLAETIDYAHQQGIAVHAWVETMYWWNLKYLGDPPSGHILDGPDVVCEDGTCWSVTDEYLTRDPEGRIQAEGGKAFVSPFNDAVVETVADVAGEIDANYDVDGVMLDYVRFPKADPAYGYGPSSPYDGTQSASEMQSLREEAVADMVASVAGRVSDATVASAAVFPGFYTSSSTAEYHKSQKWRPWRYSTSLDWFVPMCYDYAASGYDEDMAFSADAQTASDRMYPALAITDGHDGIDTQYAYYDDYQFDGYFVWDAGAIDGQLP